MQAQQKRKGRRTVKAIARGAEPVSLLQDYLTAAQLIAQLGITIDTLKRWNRLAIGPPFIHVGRQRLYNRESARAWLRSREQMSSVQMPV